MTTEDRENEEGRESADEPSEVKRSTLPDLDVPPGDDVKGGVRPANANAPRNANRSG